jgi:Polysaccharide pyruvyl transferase
MVAAGGTRKHVVLRSAKDPWDVLTPGQNLRRNRFGSNTGNLVFAHAAHRALSAHGVKVSSNRFAISATEANRINDAADVFVVPLANAFRLSFRDTLVRLTEMIEQLTVPVVVLGVGAQGTFEGDTSRLASIDAEVKRFVGAVLDRSPSIGVRGEVTYDYLRRLGFSDVDVIGCPAMYMWGADLAVRPPTQRLRRRAKVSLGVSPYVAQIGPILTANLERYPDQTYLPQDIATLRLLLRGSSPVEDLYGPDLPVRLSHPLFAEDKVRFFVDVPPWLEHLSDRDFYVGTRIHGTIAALLAGTPAFLLAHDSRTRELADYHCIPYRGIRDVAPDVDFAELYEATDLTEMVRAHPARLASFVSFLERNGLEHVFGPGGTAAAFDRRVAAADFPQAVRAPSPIRVRANRLSRTGWRKVS